MNRVVTLSVCLFIHERVDSSINNVIKLCRLSLHRVLKSNKQNSKHSRLGNSSVAKESSVL